MVSSKVCVGTLFLTCTWSVLVTHTTPGGGTEEISAATGYLGVLVFFLVTTTSTALETK
jgi:hypothetical protein